jgi:alpha-tubulin suppressor-like RCC1 family protein
MKHLMNKSVRSAVALGAAALCSALVATSAHAVQPAISVGYDHALVLRADGTVWSWGYGGSGQLGLGSDTATRTTPTQIPTLQNVVQVVARGSFSMALKADGSVWAWGDNSGGRTGGSGTSVPVRVNGLANIVSINAGTNTAAAFATDAAGQVYAWGSNSTAQLGSGQTSPGGNPVPRLVAGAQEAVAVSASDAAVLALRQDGKVLAWGSNGNKALAPVAGTATAPVVIDALPSVQAIASTSINIAGQYYALQSDGTVVVWGQASTNAPYCGQKGLPNGGFALIDISPIIGLTRISQIEPGEGHTLFVDADGAVHACGVNTAGQLGDGSLVNPSTEMPKIAHITGLPPVVAAAAGSANSAAIGVDGSVWVWGKASHLASGATDKATTPVRVTQAGGAPFDAGRVGEAAGTFAGGQSGALSNVTVDVAASISPLHRGKTGRIYVAAVAGANLLFLSPNGWSVYRGGAVPAYHSAALPRVMPVRIASGLDFSGLQGVQLVVGYGVGDDAQAVVEMLRAGRFQVVHTLN